MIELDQSVDKLERNFQRGYDHVDPKGKHWHSIPVAIIVEALDAMIARRGVNDPSAFLELVYRITAHQSYHQAIDEEAQISYSRIATMLKEGDGNPRLQNLEDLLNALGVSLAICRIDEREADLDRTDLQRACFFQHLIKNERWPFRESVALLFAHGLQFRIFLVEEAKELNTLEHNIQLEVDDDADQAKLRGISKGALDLAALLHFFNVRVSVMMVIDPA